VAFEEGVPVSINGERMKFLPLIIKLNEICGRHGFGRIDMIEDRVIGIKSHECYECPASLALIRMHQALETLVMDRDTLMFKHTVDQRWATLIYDGLWFSQLKEALDAFIANTQEFVTGEVRIKLFKGSLTVVGRKSDYSIYQYGLATYGTGDTFDRSMSHGWIELHSLPSRTWSRTQGPAARRAAEGHDFDTFSF
jgi:argininosuccinate synthase